MEVEYLKYFTSLTEEQIYQFSELRKLYSEWNEQINVISRKDMDNFYIHHVLHSLSIAAQFSFPDGYEAMDLGSGGGFPGIPLAIFFPEVHFHLVDSIGKKLKVVKEIAKTIGLKNVITEHTRVEQIRDKQFDIILSRAVAPLKDLWYWSKPLLKKRPDNEPKKICGLICLKGGDLSQEISECNAQPHVWEIEKLFDEPYFQNKYILYLRQ